MIEDVLQLLDNRAVIPSAGIIVASGNPHDEAGLYVLGVGDAVWSAPVRPSEQKYFVCRCRNNFYVIFRIAQGSRSAPFTFGAVSLP